MADASSPVDQNVADSLERAANSLDVVTSKLDSVSAKMAELFGRLGTESVEKAQQMGDAFKRSTTQIGQMNSTMQSTKASLQSIDVGSLTGSFSNLQAAGEAAFRSIARSAAGASDSASKDTNKVIEGLSALAAVGAAGIRVKAFEFPILKQLTEAQNIMMPLQKTALQTGIAFGDSFNKANSHVNAFMSTVTDSIMTTQETGERVSGVMAGLGDAFGATGATTAITNLAKATNQIQGVLNLTNVAMLAGKATGTDYGQMVGLLNQAHLELGEGIDGAALTLGRIGQAAEKSGLSYKRVADSILNSTSALKMFGGTVGSVAPLFEKFSASLAEGRKGLAPELLQKFTSGLQAMSFEQRAFLGIQAPGGTGRGGAIGAGLEMEAALEEGPAGMQKIMDNLTSALEKFGGGRIVSRKEAIEDPTLQRNFMIQRQLLQNMMGLDTASANKTLDMLQEVQKTGLKTGQGQEEKLAELIGSGEQVAKDTTTNQAKAINNMSVAVVNAVKEVSALLKEGKAGTAVSKLMQNFDTAMENMAKRGKFDIKETKRDLLRGLTGDEVKTANKYLQMTGTPGGTDALLKQLASQGPERLGLIRQRQARGPVEPEKPVAVELNVPEETLLPGKLEQILAEKGVPAATPAISSEPVRQAARLPETPRNVLFQQPVKSPEIPRPEPTGIFDPTLTDTIKKITKPGLEAPRPATREAPATTAPAKAETVERNITAENMPRFPGAQPLEAMARGQIDMARPQSTINTQPQEIIARESAQRIRLQPPTNQVTETVRREKQEAAVATAAATANVSPAPVAARPPVEREIIITAKLENDTIKLGTSWKRMLIDNEET